MSDWPFVELGKDDAKKALEAVAFRVWPEDRELRCMELAQWLVYLDDPTIPEAVEERRRITLTRIVDRAREAVGEPRLVVHSFLGTLGADHDLERALALVDEADRVGWMPHLLRHELAVVVGRRRYNFDVKRPDAEGGNDWTVRTA